MPRRSRRASLLSGLLVGACLAGCPDRKAAAPATTAATTATPSGTVTLMLKAMADEDVGAYLALLPEKDRVAAEAGRAAVGKDYDATIVKAIQGLKGTLAGGTVVKEEITDETATVLVKSSSGQDVSWKCVKEADGWRIAFTR